MREGCRKSTLTKTRSDALLRENHGDTRSIADGHIERLSVEFRNFWFQRRWFQVGSINIAASTTLV